MNQSGFKPAVAENELTSMNATWNSFEGILTNDAQSFITLMSGGWYEGVAVKFFNEVYVPAIRNMYNTLQSQMKNIFDVVNGAGDKHNETSGVAHFSRVSFNGISGTSSLDAGAVLDIAPDGFVGIYPDTLESGKRQLLDIINSLNLNFDKLAQDVSDIAFYGGAVALQSALISSITEIKDRFKNETKNVVDSFCESLSVVAEQHDELASAVNSSFTLAS